MLKQFSSLFVSLPATTVGAVAAVGAVTLASAGWSSIDPPPQRWQLGEVVVEDERAPALAEQDLVGPPMQPKWTSGRRFLTTDVYVLPEGHADFEAFATASIARDRDGGGTAWSFSEGIGIGLPNRFQLEFALLQDIDAGGDHTLGGAEFEARWAIADWNQVWGNPTLALGFETLAARPDVIEPRLLLGGEICDGWFWGADLGLGWELSGEREVEYELTGAVSHTIIDERLAVGLESILTTADRAGARGDLDTAFLVGPSVQWRPSARASLRCAPLVGIGGDSPAAEFRFNFEWEF